MAISKMQPMRSAEIDLVDTVNAQDSTLAIHTQAINTLSTGLDAEVAERERMDTYISGLVTDEAEARRSAIATVNDSISAIDGYIADLQSFDSHIKFGNVINLTIPANDSISYDASFIEPFESDATVIVLAQVVTSELLTLFDYTLTACDYSGFSFTLRNSDSDAHTVSLGYVAFRTSADPII